jgi:GH15 family glucan-1,4-alpha-glucosidase
MSSILALALCWSLPAQAAHKVRKKKARVALTPGWKKGRIGRAAKQARTILRDNTRTVDVGKLGMKRKKSFTVAGSGHFPDFWTRDGMFAYLGKLTMKEAGAATSVGDSLQVLYSNQRKDGLLPRRIGNGSNALAMPKKVFNRLRGKETPIPTEFKTAEYTNRMPELIGMAGAPVDSNSLTVWLTDRYVTHLERNKQGKAARKFIKRNLDAAERAVQWYEGQMDEDGLVIQKRGMSDWKDTTGRRGAVLYTNALYYQSLVSMANLAEKAGQPGKAAHYKDRAATLKKRINGRFWDKKSGFYQDALHKDADPGVFSADGNFLAVHFGLASKHQAKRILKTSQSTIRNQLYRNQNKAYPKKWSRWNRFAGKEMANYNALVIFPFHNALAALAAIEVGDLETARTALEGMARAAERDKTFEETYKEDGSGPFSARLRVGLRYDSEPDFSWSAGLYLYALDKLEKAEAAQAANR